MSEREREHSLYCNQKVIRIDEDEVLSGGIGDIGAIKKNSTQYKATKPIAAAAATTIAIANIISGNCGGAIQAANGEQLVATVFMR